jgi:hypothetical protein
LLKPAAAGPADTKIGKEKQQHAQFTNQLAWLTGSGKRRSLLFPIQ